MIFLLFFVLFSGAQKTLELLFKISTTFIYSLFVPHMVQHVQETPSVPPIRDSGNKITTRFGSPVSNFVNVYLFSLRVLYFTWYHKCKSLFQYPLLQSNLERFEIFFIDWNLAYICLSSTKNSSGILDS